MTDRIIYPSDGPLKRFFKKLVRKKVIDDANVAQTELARCLTTFDLIGLGIGSTLGAGIYVVAGQVAQQTAGPSVVISFLIAAVASALAGLCYAEFAARVPKAGSAYIYSYVTVGELMAFIIGWNLVLEYVIGTASVARAWSSYFDSLVDSKIQHFFQQHMPMDVPGLSSYPDFFALAITLVLTAILAIGVKESTTFNNIFTCVNLLVVLYVIICGFFKLNIHNWQLSPSEVPDGAGSGGFMPFGVSGMLSGAATCFYAFVGFDCIATTGEETNNPQRSIPISIIVSLLVIFLAYFGISAVITLMAPYYLLDNQAPLPKVFDSVGWGVAKYIIAIGAVSGLSTSLLGAMFPLPRVLYAMGSDGVIFRFMGKVNDRFKTPVIGTAISGVFAGVMAMLFNLKELVDMMSIGTLLAYTLVSVSVLILRYETEENLPGSNSRQTLRDTEPSGSLERSRTIHVSQLFLPISQIPSKTSASVAICTIWIFCLCCITFSCMLIFAADQLSALEWWAILLAVAFGLCLLTSVIVIWRQPCSTVPLNFKVPFVPLLPCVSIFVNLFLMLKLSIQTWMRFGVWMFIGFLIYFCYGIRKSSEGQQRMSVVGGSKYQTFQNEDTEPRTGDIQQQDDEPSPSMLDPARDIRYSS